MLGNKAHDECGATVSQQQFGKYVEAAQLIEKRDQEIMAAFRVFETEGQPDIINVEEFRHAMMTLGDKLTDEEVSGDWPVDDWLTHMCFLCYWQWASWAVFRVLRKLRQHLGVMPTCLLHRNNRQTNNSQSIVRSPLRTAGF